MNNKTSTNQNAATETVNTARELQDAELASIAAGMMPMTPEQCREIAGNSKTWGF